ncbi:MAG: sugar phosphate isomerase/epimerase family protein [Planctomycetota bacterium]|jgi:xylose isomerase
MDEPVKHAVITSFLSATKDRFHEYNAQKTLEERLQMASDIEGVSGVETVFPYEVCDDPRQMKRLLEKYSLGISAVNVNVKAEPEFRNGSLTSTDAQVRAKAVEFIKKAKDYAKAVGADKVTCCPLADGYEFSFQYDYGQAWKNLVETLGEAGDYLREIPLLIEYKPSETRGRCFIDTAAKALLLLNEIGIEQMGVTLDFGHSMYGNENPAEAVSLLAQSRFCYYIHINDNNGKWDWDYMVGTHHLLDYLEFLYYLQKSGYDDFFTSDTSPTRWDIKGTFEMNVRLAGELGAIVTKGDYLQTWRWIEEKLLSL